MKTVAIEQAIGMIPDGATVMVGGFMGVGTPERMMDELVRQGRRDLTVIANDTAMPGRGVAKLLETAPGVSVETVLAATEARLEVPKHVPEMNLLGEER